MVDGLAGAGVPVIEVSHGDGLSGSSYNYGFSAVDERVLMQSAVEAAAGRSRIAALMLPGVGTMDDIRACRDIGVSVVRIATHCTEADISRQHFAIARELGLETVGFLMMSHTQPPEVLAAQARVMADAGSQCVYVVDSAGALILDEVSDRVSALVAELGDDAQVGFHGHQNLSLGVANTVLAIRAGAVQADGCTRSFGAGSGNTPTEALAAVLDRLGIRTGIDPLEIFDVAEEVVRPVMERRVRARPHEPDHGLRRACTRASCATPTGRPSATGSPVRRSSCAAANGVWSVVRRTRSSTWRSS